jgi:hypothetical protein
MDLIAWGAHPGRTKTDDLQETYTNAIPFSANTQLKERKKQHKPQFQGFSLCSPILIYILLLKYILNTLMSW